MNTNVRAVYNLTMLAVPHLEATKVKFWYFVICNCNNSDKYFKWSSVLSCIIMLIVMNYYAYCQALLCLISCTIMLLVMHYYAFCHALLCILSCINNAFCHALLCLMSCTVMLLVIHYYAFCHALLYLMSCIIMLHVMHHYA